MKHKAKIKNPQILGMIFVVCLFSLIMCTPVQAVNFKDLNSKEECLPYVNYLVQKNVINGFPDGTFRPAGLVTRAEMAKMIVSANKTTTDQKTPSAFSDVTENYWAYNAINSAAREGLIKGYPDEKFRPEAPVSRAEVTVMLLRLTHAPMPEISTPLSVKDLNRYWAAGQIAVALDAGIMKLDTEGVFAPDKPATRAEVARGLAMMLTLSPDHNQVNLIGTFSSTKGQVQIIKADGSRITVTDKQACNEGDTIITGQNSSVQLQFPDGSGFRINNLTKLTIKKAVGTSAISQDGSPLTVIDNLEVVLSQGQIFGALASSYQKSSVGYKYKPVILGQLQLAALKLPSDLAAQSNSSQLPWYQASTQKKVRVKVDMPWGVAAVRGTFWMNEVRDGREVTDTATGNVEVTANGQTVSVGPGQASNVTSANSSPTSPTVMSYQQQQFWNGVQQWVQETIDNIQNAELLQQAASPSGSSGATEIINNIKDAIPGFGGTTINHSSNNSSGSQATASSPTASPAAGTYNTVQNISLSTATDGATIYYTTDGSIPNTSSLVYTTPIAVSATTTIKAYTVKTGMNDSAVVSLTYTITAPQNSTISPSSGTFDKKIANQADMTVAMILNGNSLTAIIAGANSLAAGTDYTVSGSDVTIKKAYLASQAVGSLTLTFQFSAGASDDLLIDIIDTSTLGYTYSRQWGSLFNVKSNPQGVALDSTGNIYVVDSTNNQIFKFDPAGNVLTRWGRTGTGDGQFDQPWAVAVDSTDNIYVCDMGNNRIQKFNSNGTYIRKWGSSGNSNGQFNCPTGIAVSSAGNVYIADSQNARVQKFTSDGNFLSVIGSSGSGAGQFDSPRSVAVDSLNNLYVTDYILNRVQKFASDDTLVCLFASSGSGNGQLDNPEGITVSNDGTTVYVSDTYNHRIELFNYDAGTGNYIYSSQWGVYGSNDGQFLMATGLALDGAGSIFVADRNTGRIQKFTTSGVFNSKIAIVTIGDGRFYSPQRGIAIDAANGWIYVCDTQNDRIQKFNLNGDFIAKWGTEGTNDGQFNQPTGLATDPAGNVYVADTVNHRIQKFTSDGIFICKIGNVDCYSSSVDGQFDEPSGLYVDASGNLYVADYNNARIQKFSYSGGSYVFASKWGTWGNAGGQFNYPVDIKGDASGNIYVSDFMRDRIQKFDNNGTFITMWGSYGSGNSQFLYQQGIGIDVNGNVYVADRDNNRIQKFDSSGAFITSFGTTGSGNGQLTYPTGVAVDATGKVYVVDTNNNRIQVFNP